MSLDGTGSALITPSLSFALYGLSSQYTHQGGTGLGGSVHEEAHPSVPDSI